MGKSGKPSAFHKTKAKKTGKSVSLVLAKPSRKITREEQSQLPQKTRTTPKSQSQQENSWAKFNAEAILIRERMEKKSSLPLTGAFKLAPSMLQLPTSIIADSKHNCAKEVYFQETDELFMGEKQTSMSILPSVTVDKSHTVGDNSHKSFKALFMDEEDEIHLSVVPPRFVYEAAGERLTP